MTAPEIIGSISSTYTRALCMLCHEKTIEFSLTEVALGAPELLSFHPLGRMPVMRHGDFTLFESKAIASYLDRSFEGPRMFPLSVREAALTEQWVSFVNTCVDRTLIRTFLSAHITAMKQDRRPESAVIQAVMPDILSQISVLDRAVGQTGYLVGRDLTFADLNLMPILHRFQQTSIGEDVLSNAQSLLAYYHEHSRRISFVNTMPPAGPPARFSAGVSSA
ncbi:glutathione S-transferase family protein [Bradyrhizobium sp. USDA 4461]